MKAIITFHSIDTSGSVLSFHPNNFLRLIQSLVDMNLPICSLGTLLKDECKKGIAITFDDGMASVFTHALPIIKDFNIPAHLYLTTGCVGGDNYWPSLPSGVPKFQMLSWDQIEACQVGGISIDAHTQTHPNINKITVEEFAEECEACDNTIESRLGKSPDYFAYPYGIYNESARKFVEFRYLASVTTFLGCLNGKQNFAEIPRLDSYYLQPQWIQKNLGNPIGQSYIMGRSLIRTLRKHQ